MKFYGRGEVPIDSYLFNTFFNSKRFLNEDLTAVECGTSDGITGSSCYFFETILGWKCINIEAKPSTFFRLLVNRPKAINLNLVLSGENEQAVFGKSTVASIRFASLIRELKIRKIDLMTLDTSGHELQAIEGMNNCSAMPKLLCVNHSIVGLEPLKKALFSLKYDWHSTSCDFAFFRLKE